MIGSIKDDIINTTELGVEIIGFLAKEYPEALPKRYGIDGFAAESDVVMSAVELLRKIAEKKNCRKQGNELDLDRMAMMVVDDFRSGRLGKISVERPMTGDGQ